MNLHVEMLKKTIQKQLISIDSTNNWALRNINTFNPEILYVIHAVEQTLGRGRYGHSWSSDLVVSYSFLIQKHRHDLGNLSQVIALSISKVLKDFGVLPKLKWPNDILIGGKKICGILAETTILRESNRIGMVIGVGMNINHLPNIERPTTSLFHECGKEYCIETVKKKISEQFFQDYNQFMVCGFASFLEEYEANLIHQRGAAMSFHQNGMILEGFFQEITPFGTLKMKLKDGSLKEFASGEVAY